MIWDIVATVFVILGMSAMFFIGYGIGYINGSRSSYPEILDNASKPKQSLSEIKKQARRQ